MENKEINNDELINQATTKFDGFLKATGKKKNEALYLLFPNSKKSILNKPSLIKKGNINVAKEIIEAIDNYNDRIHKNKLKNISFVDLNNFFVGRNVCKNITEEESKEFEGTYLLFRYSNLYNMDTIDDNNGDTTNNNIIVSHMKIYYESSVLCYSSNRILNGIQVKTEGIIIFNRDSSYFFIGISFVENDTAKSFIETLKVAKNSSGSSAPNIGYFSGIIPTNNTPFVSKVAIVKIYNEDSILKIENSLYNNKNQDEIIKIHSIKELENEEGFIKKIFEDEKKVLIDGKQKFDYSIKKILKNLEMNDTTLKNGKFFKLQKFDETF